MKQKTLSVEASRRLDRLAQTDYGIPSILLMENAARGLVAHIETLLKPPLTAHQIVFFCGSGNNGGDGFAAARHLHQRGLNVKVILPTEAPNFTEDAGLNYRIIRSLGIPVYAFSTFDSRQKAWGSHFLILVDALIGTGFKPPLRPDIERMIQKINEIRSLHPERTRVVAVDIPSGLNGDSGFTGGPAVRADSTVTFACLKPGLLTPNARPYVGTLDLVDIGIPEELLEKFNNE